MGACAGEIEDCCCFGRLPGSEEDSMHATFQ